MLLTNQKLNFAFLSEGEANILLHLDNQELRAECAKKIGDTQAANFHAALANAFRNAYNRGLHNTPVNSLAYLPQNSATQQVNEIISRAKRKTNSAMTLPNYEVRKAFNSISPTVLQNSPNDEFDPTPEQRRICSIRANQRALREELSQSRNFTGSTFDSDRFDVIPDENQVLKLVNKANLAARESRLLERCLVDTVMSNIINKKVSEAGNAVIYKLMEKDTPGVRFNAAIRKKIQLQDGWIGETGRVTGLSYDNVLLVLENSAIRINEEPPRTTLSNIAPLVLDPDAPVPTTLPPLPSGGGSTGDPQADFIILLAKIVIKLIPEIIKLFKKKKNREDIFTKIPDPSVLIASCLDANISLPECCAKNNISPEDCKSNGSGSSLFSLGNIALVGGVGLVGFLLLTGNNKEDNTEKKANRTTRTRRTRELIDTSLITSKVNLAIG